MVVAENGVKMEAPKSLKRIPLPFSVDPNTRHQVVFFGFYQVSKLLIATTVHPDLLQDLRVLGSKSTAPKS